MAIINCPECGAQISDMANACPSCGYPIQNMQGNTGIIQEPVYFQSPREFSEHYPQIRAFSDSVKSIYVLSIISLVFCLGIGVVFSLINTVRISKLTKKPILPADQLTPREKADYETSVRKLKTAGTITTIALTISSLVLIVLIVLILIGLSAKVR